MKRRCNMLCALTISFSLAACAAIGPRTTEVPTATEMLTATVTGIVEMEGRSAESWVNLATECEDEASLRNYLSRRSPAPVGWLTTQTDASGKFVFDNVVPGRYCLVVRWRERAEQAIPTCLVMPPELVIFQVSDYEMSDRTYLSFGMYSSPFEVRDDDQIKIEISCH